MLLDSYVVEAAGSCESRAARALRRSSGIGDQEGGPEDQENTHLDAVCPAVRPGNDQP